jgi:hypothetical protein
LRAFGLTLDEASGPPVEIWPDNLHAVNVFIGMKTQWRIGMNGVTGLDYGVLQPVMRMIGVPRKDWSDVFAGIRTMEDAALTEMHKK